MPSALQFSFAQNLSWSRAFSRQPGSRYLRAGSPGSCACFKAALTGAAWDESNGHWRIETSQGEYTADIVISGVGALSIPAYPEIPGLETFEGKVMHSAQWDHDYDFSGKRVA